MKQCLGLALSLTLVLVAGCDFAGSRPPAEPAPPATGTGGTPRATGAGGNAATASGGATGTGGATPAGSAGTPATAAGGAPGTVDAPVTSPDGTAQPPPEAGAPADSAPETAPAAPYPAGPYGFRVGNVMANLSLTDRQGGAVTLQDLRMRPGARILLWSSGAEWCPACKGETRSLKMLQQQKAAQGLVIVESLHQSFDFKPANAATLMRWANAYQTNYLLTWEKSPPHEPRSNNPVVWVMDARTMKIVAREMHAEGDIVAAVNAALAAAQ
jgi:hypothetical protein